MKKILSFLAVGLTAGAFILLCFIWVLKINVLIPILMFAAAFVLLGIVKRMHEAENGDNSLNAADDSVK
jgi:ABC-type Na+ efflux pump permease subunit